MVNATERVFLFVCCLFACIFEIQYLTNWRQDNDLIILLKLLERENTKNDSFDKSNNDQVLVLSGIRRLSVLEIDVPVYFYIFPPFIFSRQIWRE